MNEIKQIQELVRQYQWDSAEEEKESLEIANKIAELIPKPKEGV